MRAGSIRHRGGPALLLIFPATTAILFLYLYILFLRTRSTRMASPPDESSPIDADEQATSLNGQVHSEAAASSGDASEAADDAEADTAPERVDLTFQGDDLDAKLDVAGPNDLNRADFGVIKIDDDGEILFFNKYESELSGVDPDEAVGKNFFTEIAPCTNNRLFRGRFKKGLRRNSLDETFTYTYTYRMRPTLVTIHLYRDERNDNWIMVQKF